MSRRVVDDGRSLFDEVEDEVSLPRLEDEVGRQVTKSEWREVAQPLFLSWSKARQFAYCAARDIDAAASVATTEQEAAWYQDRATRYRDISRDAEMRA